MAFGLPDTSFIEFPAEVDRVYLRGLLIRAAIRDGIDPTDAAALAAYDRALRHRLDDALRSQRAPTDAEEGNDDGRGTQHGS